MDEWQVVEEPGAEDPVALALDLDDPTFQYGASVFSFELGAGDGAATGITSVEAVLTEVSLLGGSPDQKLVTVDRPVDPIVERAVVTPETPVDSLDELEPSLHDSLLRVVRQVFARAARRVEERDKTDT